MIRLSRLADYGVAVVCQMAIGQDAPYSARALSDKTGISETAVMKVLKLLAKFKVIDSIRGSKGGYMITKEICNISVLDVVKAIDGPVNVALCSHEDSTSCDYSNSCVAKCGWTNVNNALQNTLASFSIADFVGSYHKNETSIELSENNYVAGT